MNEGAKKYLLVKHSRGWDVDRCCHWMDKSGKQYDWCYPADGDFFPLVSEYTGVIVFGGAWSANDDTDVDWIRQELKFIERVLETSTALLGICLGAQMLARVLGSQVFNHPANEKEVGFHPVYPTADSGDFLNDEQYFMQWHSEGFDLPAGCTSVARGEVFPNQAFKYADNTYGVQFHPEVNPAALAIWQERNRRKNPQQLTNANRTDMMRDAHKHDASVTQWFDAFLTRWAHTNV